MIMMLMGCQRSEEICWRWAQGKSKDILVWVEFLITFLGRNQIRQLHLENCRARPGIQDATAHAPGAELTWPPPSRWNQVKPGSGTASISTCWNSSSEGERCLSPCTRAPHLQRAYWETPFSTRIGCKEASKQRLSAVTLFPLVQLWLFLEALCCISCMYFLKPQSFSVLLRYHSKPKEKCQCRRFLVSLHSPKHTPSHWKPESYLPPV